MSNPEALRNFDNILITSNGFVRINSNSTVSNRLYIYHLLCIINRNMDFIELA